jgi:putative membrane protein
MRPSLKTFLQRWLVNTLGVLVAAHLVRGISYDSFIGLLIASLVLGVLNAFLRPLLLLLTLPLLLFSLGLFVLVINAFLLYFVGWLVKSFHVDSFGAAFWGSLVVSLISMLVNSLIGADTGKVSQRPLADTKRPNDDGGPVIDV